LVFNDNVVGHFNGCIEYEKCTYDKSILYFNVCKFHANPASSMKDILVIDKVAPM
jgi:hypothetical protein